MKTISGTREWSASSVNVCSGCANDCLYCYAKTNAIRFKRKTPDRWCIEEINDKAVSKNYGKRKGRIMLPTTHDITIGTIDAVRRVARHLLAHENELLIVSKPRLELIQSLCLGLQNACRYPRARVLFRFTIGSYLDSTLKFWEPGAPCFSERLATLAWCHHDGWQTSVSMEPMLECNQRMIELVEMVAPQVSDTIWLGKMNQPEARLKANDHSVLDWTTENWLIRLKHWQSDGEITGLYSWLKNHPKVRWKESIKKVVGIELAKEAGTDE
jgi:DNA repair photolyase